MTDNCHTLSSLPPVAPPLTCAPLWPGAYPRTLPYIRALIPAHPRGISRRSG
ncbi:hypothetical protein C2E23DRAFT_849690 [Lenzites betulinus]|nr:hypothetical protein C2E23DRAFT_849690 [Lenzites betulinus]